MCFLSVNILRYQTLILAAILLACNIMDTIGAIEYISKGIPESNAKLITSTSLGLNCFLDIALAVGFYAAIRKNRLLIAVYMIALIIFGLGKTFLFCTADICAKEYYGHIVTDWYRFNTAMGWITFIFLVILYARMVEESRHTVP